ncbi:hypothetical protein Pelo_5625 [Pelomyxa schiedti]|nr:hypothetical protein Pelo_5625 [Pelomyxa schiedti]
MSTTAEVLVFGEASLCGLILHGVGTATGGRDWARVWVCSAACRAMRVAFEACGALWARTVLPYKAGYANAETQELFRRVSGHMKWLEVVVWAHFLEDPSACPNLERISFTRRHGSKAQAEGVKPDKVISFLTQRMATLREITFDGVSYCSDEILETLAPHLNTIPSFRLTHFQHSWKANTLETVAQNLQSLESLSLLGSYRIPGSLWAVFFRNLPCAKTLQHLALDLTRTNEDVVTELEKFTELRDLSLGHPFAFFPSHLLQKFLVNSHNLTSLDAPNLHTRLLPIIDAQFLPNLTHLDLSKNELDPTFNLGATLAKCSSLKSLVIAQLLVTDEDLHTFLPNMAHTLKLLDFTNCYNITTAGCDAISLCTKLHHLALQGCNSITDAGIASIAHSMPNLYKIDISLCSSLTTSAVDVVLSECTHIHTILAPPSTVPGTYDNQRVQYLRSAKRSDTGA